MFKYEYENAVLRKIKFSKWYLIDITVLFSLFYAVPFVLISFCENIHLILLIIGELLFVFISIFLIILNINIFKFSIEILDDKLVFSCFKKMCLSKLEVINLGIIRRAGTALSVNPYSTSTVYFSAAEVDSSKLYKSLWQKHAVGCGIINNVFFISGHCKFMEELYSKFSEIVQTTVNAKIKENDRDDF